jgi:NADH-quinone oxidoreductase subunit C
MSNEELQAAISKLDPELEFSDEAGFLNVSIPAPNISPFMQALRTNENLNFDYMFCLTGIDWPENMSVVYHLESTTQEHCIVVKAIIDSRENPSIDTVCNIWRTAELHEREVYDLFGIVFNNHPDLRRIFLEDDWVGWAISKFYVVLGKIVVL